MSIRVRFVSSIPALCWDPDHHRMVKVVRSVDSRGRVWEEHSADGFARPVLLAAPNEPEPQKAKRKRRLRNH